MELHEDPLRLRRRALQAVHAEADLVLRHAFWQIPRDDALLPLRHVAPPSSVSHTPAAEMPTASRPGSPGHVTIECKQSPPAPGCHFGLVGCFQSARLSSQRRAAVAALEQHARVPAGVKHAVGLGGHDHPDPHEHVVAPRQIDAGRLPHSPATSSV